MTIEQRMIYTRSRKKLSAIVCIIDSDSVPVSLAVISISVIIRSIVVNNTSIKNNVIIINLNPMSKRYALSYSYPVNFTFMHLPGPIETS